MFCFNRKYWVLIANALCSAVAHVQWSHTSAGKRLEWVLRVNKQLLLENDSHLIYFIANYLFVVFLSMRNRTLHARPRVAEHSI